MGAVVVLGVNAAHDASACLLVDGVLVAAISEERLTRRRYHEGFPYQAVDYCLRAGSIDRLDSVDCLVLNEYTYSDFDLELRNHGFPGRLITNPSHHLLHAYYAWAASGYTNPAIMVVDGSGYSWGEYERRHSPLIGESPPFSEMEEAESLYQVRDGAIEIVAKRWALWEASEPLYRFASLGHLYSVASQYIFGHWRHAGKTMGLAPYGDPSAFPDRIVDVSGDEMVIDTTWASRLPPRSRLSPQDDPVCLNLAAKVQVELERAMVHLANRLHERTGRSRLAISGGVGLNGVANYRIRRESPFSDVFVTPASGDAGVAIGGALYGYHVLTGFLPAWSYTDDYHGRRYLACEIDACLERRRSLVSWEAVDDVADRAAEDVAAGRVVGWFELGSEFGPRALGHRSIVCDPRDSSMRDRLNEWVKFREPFRPYGASVLAERAAEYFEIDVDDPFMLTVAMVRADQAKQIPSVCHVDGSCRIQSVRPTHPGRFRALIEAFERRTATPLVLNTSFNIRGEPIVETPDDSLECFLASNVDVLYLEGRRVTKVHLSHLREPDRLVPVLSSGVILEMQVASGAGAALEESYFVRTRTGHRTLVSRQEFTMLRAIDRIRSVEDIAGHVGAEVSSNVLPVFVTLQERGLVAFEAVSGPGS